MAQAIRRHRTHPLTKWSHLIPEDQWQVYQAVIEGASKREIPFAMGGAFAAACYIGTWRNTKDLDLYVLPEYRERMIQVLTDAGLGDYFDEKPYDRWWIYRGEKGGCIVDVIWAMANHRAQIDDLWMSGPDVDVNGRRLKILPPEALLWDKVYIMQRDRCDWPDVLNLLFCVGPDVDWEYLLERMGDDAALIAGALRVFQWAAPGRAQQLPSWIWDRLHLPAMPSAPLPSYVQHRVSLLDTRPWFAPEREKLEPAA